MRKKEDAGARWVSFRKKTVVLYLDCNDQSELIVYAIFKLYLHISYL